MELQSGHHRRMSNSIANDVYFLFDEDGNVDDWTEDIEEARKWAIRPNHNFARYSSNPLDRKPYERVREDDYQQLDTLAE